MHKIATGTLAASGIGTIALLANPATATAAPMPLPDIPVGGDMVKSLAERVLPPAPEVPMEKGTLGNVLMFRKEDTDNTGVRHDEKAAATPSFDPGITVDDLNTAATNTRVAKLAEAFTGASGVENFSTFVNGSTQNGTAMPTTDTVKSAWDKLWSDVYTPFAEAGVERTREEGVQGLADLIDSMVTNPVATIQGAITASGGIQAWSNPQEALTRLVTSVVGPEYGSDVLNVITNLAIPFLTKDLPLATLAGLATLLMTPLLPALAGALAGGSLSGLMGSTIGLAIAATLTYGLWLLIGIPVIGAIGIVLGIIVAVVILAIGIILTPFMLFSPLPFLFSFGAAGIGLLFVPLLAIVAYVALTWWMPTLAFMLLAPLLMATGGLLGSIPGALMGGSLGYLAGLVAAIPLAGLVFALVGNGLWNNRLAENPEARKAWDRLADLWGRSWNTSNTGNLINSINDMFWESPIGRAIKPFVDVWNALWANINWDAIRNGAILGGLQGIWDGLRTGFPAGALAGALLGLPLLLLTLAASIVPPIAIGFMAAVFATLVAALPVLAIAVPLWLISVPIVLTGFLINGLGTLLILSVIGAPLGIPLFGFGWGIAGAGAGYASFIAVTTAIILGLIFLANLGIVGVPVFLLTLPLFLFPAMGINGLLYLGAILGSGLLAALVGAIYGAGSGGIKGALAGLPFALNWGGAIEKIGFGLQGATPAAPEAPTENRVAVPDFMSPNWGTAYQNNADKVLVAL